MAALLALSLAVVALSAPVPTLQTSVVAQDDDDDDRDDDDEGGEIDEDDEDDNRGHWNDDDGDDDDNPGRGNGNRGNQGNRGNGSRGNDEEDEFVTAVPTETTEPRAEPTRPALTPVSSPTTTASTPITTGTLVIRLRVCPAAIDPAIGVAALRDECPDGRADAEFQLTGRSGLYSGWRRTVTTGTGGDARVDRLAEGTYNLTLDELDWCAAEASSVDDGLIAVEPGDSTEVTAYLCDNPDATAPAGS